MTCISSSVASHRRSPPQLGLVRANDIRSGPDGLAHPDFAQSFWSFAYRPLAVRPSRRLVVYYDIGKPWPDYELYFSWVIKRLDKNRRGNHYSSKWTVIIDFSNLHKRISARSLAGFPMLPMAAGHCQIHEAPVTYWTCKLTVQMCSEIIIIVRSVGGAGLSPAAYTRLPARDEGLFPDHCGSRPMIHDIRPYLNYPCG